jgi:hypothetical protein
MWPSTPVNVKSGMKAAMIIAAANRIDFCTTVPA